MSTKSRASVRERQGTYKFVLRLLASDAALRQSYETLLSSLRLLNGSRPLKTLLFTSAQPEEGKTTVAVSLALTMARAGKRTLLVDADLRRPQIHRMLELENTPGLTDVVAAKVHCVDVVRVIEIPVVAGATSCRLSVVTSGHTSASAFEALQSPILADAIRELAEAYDAVLIDSPPVLSVSDPLMLASLVDGVVLIVNTGTVAEADVSRAKQQLEQAGGHVLGVVMNRFDENVYGPGFHPYHAYYDAPKSRS